MDFNEIPDVVWKLFDEIINYERSVKLLSPGERANAYSLAWGWNPPLLKQGTDNQLTFHGLAAYAWRDEQRKEKRKRTGRPRSCDASGFDLIESALIKHHGYEAGGSVENYEPASLKVLESLSGKSKATASRFLEDKFGKPGHKRYIAACQREEIGALLAKWSGELFKEHLDLAVEEHLRRREDD